MLMHERRQRRIQEGELITQAAQAPPNDSRGHLDTRDLVKTAKRHDEIAVPVQRERIAVRPVHAGTGAFGGIEIRDIEVIERVPLKRQAAAWANMLDHGAGDPRVCNAPQRSARFQQTETGSARNRQSRD